MICPKCGFSQPDDVYCAFCGVSIEKYLGQRRKKQYKVWILIAMVGVVVISIAKYINSLHRVETTEPASEYGHQENNVQSKDPAPTVSELDSPKNSDHFPPSPSHKESLRPARLEDERRTGDEATGSSPLEQQKAELRDDLEAKTYTAKEWFEKGRALDDESGDEIQCYQKALELDPEFAPAYYCLGAIYWRQANYELAYQEFAKFLKYASEVERRVYNIYVYCSPSDVERLSEEKVKGEASAEEAEEEKPSEVPKETQEATGEERDQETSEEVMTIVRFVPIDGHIVAPVLFNGFLEASMLIDTGAGITVLSKELAQKLQLEGQPGNSITLKTMAIDVQAQLATLDSIKVGNLIQNNLPVAITDLPRGEKRRFDGILGMDFMNNYRIQIDNENSRILLSPGKNR